MNIKVPNPNMNGIAKGTAIKVYGCVSFNLSFKIIRLVMMLATVSRTALSTTEYVNDLQPPWTTASDHNIHAKIRWPNIWISKIQGAGAFTAYSVPSTFPIASPSTLSGCDSSADAPGEIILYANLGLALALGWGNDLEQSQQPQCRWAVL